MNIIDDLHLLTGNGVYPYDYIDNWDRFNHTERPPKDSFYRQLSNSHISDEEYERAKHVWEHFNITNMGEYHDLYLQTAVLRSADIFASFRTM